MLIYKILIYIALVLVFLVFQYKKKLWKQQLSFEEYFEKYLSEVASAYGKYQNIEEAMWELESDMKETLPEKNAFVQMFQAMCTLVKNEGDLLYHGNSIFLMNLQYLKEELRGHLLLYRERSYLFLGLDYLAILPIFFLPLVESWADTTSENMAQYYEGGYGVVAILVLFLVTILIYLLVLWLLLPQITIEKKYALEKRALKIKWLSKIIDRYINWRYTYCFRKNELLKELQGYGNIREFLVKKLMWGAVGCICGLVMLQGYFYAEREQIRNDVVLNEYQSMLIKEPEKYDQLLQEYFIQMAAQKEDADRENYQVLEKALLEQRVPDEAAEEILEKFHENLIKYRSTTAKWYDFLLLLFLFVGAAQLPEVFLIVERWKSKDKRMEEGLRMQTVTLLLIHYEETTVEEILLQMEHFSEVFRQALAKAVDTFSYQRTKTLEKLKEDIVDEGMQRIAESLLFCEELPVEEAFVNLEGERDYFLKRNQEERKNNQREYAALARMMAYLPLFFLIVLELVVPFIAEGLNELSIYSQGLMGMIL